MPMLHMRYIFWTRSTVALFSSVAGPQCVLCISDGEAVTCWFPIRPLCTISQLPVVSETVCHEWRKHPSPAHTFRRLSPKLPPKLPFSNFCSVIKPYGLEVGNDRSHLCFWKCICDLANEGVRVNMIFLVCKINTLSIFKRKASKAFHLGVRLTANRHFRGSPPAVIGKAEPILSRSLFMGWCLRHTLSDHWYLWHLFVRR